MGENSGIEWTDATWNPMRGCERISPGCLNCYAEHHAGRFCGEGQPWEGYAERTDAGARWTRKVSLVPEKLLQPLSWQRPRRIFVNAMSDTFHESLPDEDVDSVFAVMLLAPRHTFQVLTKRAERMAAYFADERTPDRIWDAANAMHEGRHVMGFAGGVRPFAGQWPFQENVWLGVSVESQDYAERVSHLLEIKAARVRYVSVEPLLGRVDLTRVERKGFLWNALQGVRWKLGTKEEGAPNRGVVDAECPALDWVIVGGESGRRSRPMRLEWARELITAGKTFGVPVFMKQFGTHPQVGYYDGDARRFYDEGGWDWPDPVGWHESDGQPGDGKGGRPDDVVELHVSRKGGDPSEWPESFRVREFPS